VVNVKHNVEWRRKHDPAEGHRIAPTVWYPTSLRDLIEICSNPPGGLTADGSHYALSGAAISDDAFIETNDPSNQEPAMARTLHEVLPGCISQSLLGRLENEPATHYPIHVEAGKRIYQLYSELDYGVGHHPDSLARYIEDRTGRRDYLQPWALPTMGSAGEQTIVGAFSTGTHGGDIDLQPIADAVEAIHLVTDGGRHYWIERLDRGTWAVPLVDDASLRGIYNEASVGRDIEIIRDNSVFNSVLVAAGALGVIYSVVLAVVPQFGLRQRTDLDHWENVKAKIQNRNTDLWRMAGRPSTHYLGVIVCLSPIANGSANRVAIQRRWVAADTQSGVAERRGDPGTPPAIDPRTNSYLFPNAGQSHAFGLHRYPSMIEVACSAGGFLEGVISGLADEIERYVESHGEVVGAAILAVGAVGGGGLLALLPQFALLLVAIRAFLDEFDFEDTTVAEVMEAFRKVLMGASEETGLPAPTFIWRLVTDLFFGSMLTDGEEIEAVSYAIMDTHDYLDRNCFVDVDSLEVFFNSEESRLLAYIDALIAFERNQQAEGRSFFGVVGIRFMRGTDATVGPQRWSYTASAEVAGLHGVRGTRELMDYASRLACDLGVGGFLHWGQRNETTADWLARTLQASGDLGLWRTQLRRLTDDGRLNHFGNAQTRAWGLEVR